MNAAPRTQESPSGKEISPAEAPPFPRLGFPLGLIAIYWVLYFAVGRVDKPYFYGFIYGLASALLFALCFFGWWWFNRAIRLSEKALGFVLIVGAGFVAGKFSD